MVDPEESELGTACARIAGDLRRERDDRLARLGDTERFLAANTLRQSRWAGASLRPGTKRALHQPILTRMITDHRKGSAAGQGVAHDRKRSFEASKLLVDG